MSAEMPVETTDPWLRSPERQRARGRSRGALLAGTVLLYAAVGVFIQGEAVGLNSPGSRGLVITLLLLIGLGGWIYYFNVMSSARAEFEERQRDDAQANVDAAAEDVLREDSLLALLRLNREQMKQYHLVSLQQASGAYRMSQAAMSAGLAVLVVGGGLAVTVLRESVDKITIAVLTGLGSAISAYIGNTYLQTYKKTLAQLNFYFRQPLVSSYYLHAERMVKDLAKDERDPVTVDLIRNIMTITIPHVLKQPVSTDELAAPRVTSPDDSTIAEEE